ncbi:ORC-CDC6 family AAA ATPase [Anaerovorax odorimutans]|uniref:ORC-CDC6 family AAA ATPase n=1 Tax=Anaerovorax odorimutans TaxID=109327 RepID=UPI00040C0730|nr:hypothetical protein [Anaerovorax odorimutans]
MENFTLRTEDLTLDEIAEIYVDTKLDRENIDFLKSNAAGLLIGSRGTGKTMLLRMAEKELINEFETNRILPIFVSFSSAALVGNKDELFKKWMLSKILFAFQGQLKKMGLLKTKNIFSLLIGVDNEETDKLAIKINNLIKELEKSWKGVNEVENESTPFVEDIDYFKELVNTVCENLQLRHIIFLFDEACHNFLPKQQREFFTLFRDLRASKICCKAAVYPGITSYGTFEVFHDSIVKRVEKDILAEDYVEKMRDIIERQINQRSYNILIQQGELLNSLIYASTGNPRILLKSIYEASEKLTSFKKANINATIKDFYRNQMWNEYTKLGGKFAEYKEIIDWGRNFIEDKVLTETYKKNNRSENEEDYGKQTIYFIVHKDAPELVKKAISILEYSGIVMLHTEGYKIRGAVYNRYQINMGIVATSGSESDLAAYINKLRSGLSIKVVTEFGANSIAFKDLESIRNNIKLDETAIDLQTLLEKNVDILDIYEYQKVEIKKEGFCKLYDILDASEDDLQRARLIGPVRARNILNLSMHALLEYIVG